MEKKNNQLVFQDIENRSRNGAFIYGAAWFLISFGTGFIDTAPVVFYSILSGFVILGAGRLLITQLRAKTKLIPFKFWVASIYISAVVPALMTSILFSLSFVNPLFEPMFNYLLMTLFAIISGGLVNFSPRSDLSYTYLTALVTPPFITSAFFSTSHYLEGAMLVTYGLFMMALSRRLGQEYEQRVRQQIELERINNQDSLTGVSNRRAFDYRFAQEWKTQVQAKAPLSLLVIDIDFFKNINDTFGHAAGDEVIKQTANEIACVFKRQSDDVARIGGEEFAVIVPNTAHYLVVQLAEKIRRKVEKAPIEFDDEHLSVEVSIGVATCIPKEETTTELLFKHADSCLYKAKNTGRNRVIAEEIV
ncbi:MULTISPECIES: GGDEF domain-containing protein [Alteromonadaceae]|uniref:diguanylate cyclase n=1 Tax=Brumicola blandensis TaxID=3075611 RepID=A0AAW8QY62_9ALTE|nr:MULTISPECIES: GGDEF domain-containing protein [unclassified Alteromonas]MDT0580941.1 GGDEF domain-containing protein [Alteromonas sp. W409]MDT0629630.1 GGDEF domain-containing protein [Alteromonas sp. W364]